MTVSISVGGGNITFQNGYALTIGLEPDRVVAESGNIVIVKGRNASGKTSFIKAISGIYEHYSDGRIEHSLRVEAFRNGAPARVHPSIVRHATTDPVLHAGYLAQSPRANIFCQTVEDEIAFSLEHSNFHASEVNSRLASALDDLSQFGIKPKKNPHFLSKGQQQVVGFKCLLQTSPDVLFLDEPTAALDMCALEWFSKKLFDALQNSRIQIIFVVSLDTRLITMLKGLACTKVVNVSGVLDHERQPEDWKVETKGQLVGETIKLSNFATSWGDFVVSIPDLHLESGDTVILEGRNGSGKSTVLDSIAGYKKADRGELVCGGIKQRAGRKRSRSFSSYAFQNAEEQICFFRAREDLMQPKKYVCWETHCRPLVEAADLNLGSIPWHLSFGQRKMLTYCSLLLTSPMLLIDEPLTSLDSNLRHLLIKGVNLYLKEGGIVIFTASREYAELNKIAGLQKILI